MMKVHIGYAEALEKKLKIHVSVSNILQSSYFGSFKQKEY